MRWHFRLISPGFQPGSLIASIEAALHSAQVRPLLTGRALKRLTACSDAWFETGAPLVRAEEQVKFSSQLLNCLVSTLSRSAGVSSGDGWTVPGNGPVSNKCFDVSTWEGAAGMLQSWSWLPSDPDCFRCGFVSFGESPDPAVRPTGGLQVTRRRSGTGRPAVAEDGRVRRTCPNQPSRYLVQAAQRRQHHAQRQRLVQPEPAGYRDLCGDRDLPDPRQFQGAHSERQRLGHDRHGLCAGRTACRER